MANTTETNSPTSVNFRTKKDNLNMAEVSSLIPDNPAEEMVTDNPALSVPYIKYYTALLEEYVRIRNMTGKDPVSSIKELLKDEPYLAIPEYLAYKPYHVRSDFPLLQVYKPSKNRPSVIEKSKNADDIGNINFPTANKNADIILSYKVAPSRHPKMADKNFNNLYQDLVTDITRDLVIDFAKDGVIGSNATTRSQFTKDILAMWDTTADKIVSGGDHITPRIPTRPTESGDTTAERRQRQYMINLYLCKATGITKPEHVECILNHESSGEYASKKEYKNGVTTTLIGATLNLNKLEPEKSSGNKHESRRPLALIANPDYLLSNDQKDAFTLEYTRLFDIFFKRDGDNTDLLSALDASGKVIPFEPDPDPQINHKRPVFLDIVHKYIPYIINLAMKQAKILPNSELGKRLLDVTYGNIDMGCIQVNAQGFEVASTFLRNNAPNTTDPLTTVPLYTEIRNALGQKHATRSNTDLGFQMYELLHRAIIDNDNITLKFNHIQSNGSPVSYSCTVKKYEYLSLFYGFLYFRTYTRGTNKIIDFLNTLFPDSSTFDALAALYNGGRGLQPFRPEYATGLENHYVQLVLGIPSSLGNLSVLRLNYIKKNTIATVKELINEFQNKQSQINNNLLAGIGSATKSETTQFIADTLKLLNALATKIENISVPALPTVRSNATYHISSEKDTAKYEIGPEVISALPRLGVVPATVTQASSTTNPSPVTIDNYTSYLLLEQKLIACSCELVHLLAIKFLETPTAKLSGYNKENSLTINIISVIKDIMLNFARQNTTLETSLGLHIPPPAPNLDIEIHLKSNETFLNYVMTAIDRKLLLPTHQTVTNPELREAFMEKVIPSYGSYLENIRLYLLNLSNMSRVTTISNLDEKVAAGFGENNRALKNNHLFTVFGELLTNENIKSALTKAYSSRQKLGNTVDKSKISDNEVEIIKLQIASDPIVTIVDPIQGIALPEIHEDIENNIIAPTYAKIINASNKGIISIASILRRILRSDIISFRNLHIKNEDTDTSKTTVTKFKINIGSSVIPIYMDGSDNPMLQNFGGNKPTIDLSIMTNDLFMLDDVMAACTELDLTFRTRTQLTTTSPLSPQIGTQSENFKSNSLFFDLTRKNILTKLKNLTSANSDKLMGGSVSDAPILITNNLANMMGVYGVVLEKGIVTSVEGFPNTFQIDLSFIGVDINQEIRETPVKRHESLDPTFVMADIARFNSSAFKSINVYKEDRDKDATSAKLQINNIQNAMNFIIAHLVMGNYLIHMLKPDAKNLGIVRPAANSIGSEINQLVSLMSENALAIFVKDVIQPILLSIRNSQFTTESSINQIIKKIVKQRILKLRDTLSSTKEEDTQYSIKVVQTRENNETLKPPVDVITSSLLTNIISPIKLHIDLSATNTVHSAAFEHHLVYGTDPSLSKPLYTQQVQEHNTGKESIPLNQLHGNGFTEILKRFAKLVFNMDINIFQVFGRPGEINDLLLSNDPDDTVDYKMQTELSFHIAAVLASLFNLDCDLIDSDSTKFKPTILSMLNMSTDAELDIIADMFHAIVVTVYKELAKGTYLEGLAIKDPGTSRQAFNPAITQNGNQVFDTNAKAIKYPELASILNNDFIADFR